MDETPDPPDAAGATAAPVPAGHASLRRTLERAGGTSWRRADWLLAAAAASLLLVPATWGASLAAGPVVLLVVGRDLARYEAGGVRPPERVVVARTLARIASVVALVALVPVVVFAAHEVAGVRWKRATVRWMLLGEVAFVVAVALAVRWRQARRARRARPERRGTGR